MRPDQVAQPALDPVADDGVADGLADHEPDPRAASADVPSGDAGGRPGCATRPAGRARTAVRKDSASVEPMGRGQHGGCSRASRPQTARLLRPLRRREDRMERPARVRMRRRNPCIL